VAKVVKVQHHLMTQLFTLVSNDVIKPTVQIISQFRVHRCAHWMLIPTMDGKDLRGRVLRVRVQEVVDEARGGQKKECCQGWIQHNKRLFLCICGCWGRMNLSLTVILQFWHFF